VRLPGDRRRALARQAQADGVHVPQALYVQLLTLLG